ncbi:hypothetical protein POM88_052416 [Heracleum sosnowskyi]|uniref:Uncharacterized protein n=1 Tax=Heracleum sosnowskyi TaxID=360622 RepID=A0AAD8LXY4_9APIA|nr:hypothetical protein POM88_052416 [Heracleum sosnowskyi]
MVSRISVRIPVGERMDYETERFPLLRSNFQLSYHPLELDPRMEAAPAPAPAPTYAQQAAAAPAFAQQAAHAHATAPAYAQQAAPAPVLAQQAAPRTVFPQQAARAATAFFGVTAHSLPYQPAVYSEGPLVTPSFSSYELPGSFSPALNYQQSPPGFRYHQVITSLCCNRHKGPKILEELV